MRLEDIKEPINLEDPNPKGCAELLLAVMINFFRAYPKKDYFQNKKRYRIMENFYNNADKTIEHTCDVIRHDEDKIRKEMKKKLDRYYCEMIK